MATGKILVVTGGSRGIGAAIAQAAAAQGWRVAISCRDNQAAAAAVVAKITGMGGEADYMMADLARPEQAESLFRWVDSRFGQVEGLVNNAGITGPRARIDHQPPQSLQEVLSVNALGAAWCLQCAAARMARSSGGAGGSVVNISSQAAVFGGTNVAGYAMSKAAVNALTVAAARELAGEGIRVNAVSPGVIETQMLHDLSAEQRAQLDRTLPMGRAGQPQEVAEAVLWLLSDVTAYISGVVLPVAGGR